MKQSINVNGAPAAVGPYVHAVKTGNMIFMSGQLGLNPVHFREVLRHRQFRVLRM